DDTFSPKFTSFYVKLGVRKYYLSVTYNVPYLDFKHNDKYLAMDIGVSKHTMVDSAGNFSEVINKRPDNTGSPKSNRYNPEWITARDTVKNGID
ncbi:MAG: hypothetical protein ACLFMM_07995, partial [Methanohalobium sp.]